MRKWLIHLLGGYTQEEFGKECLFNYEIGARNTIDNLIYIAKGLHGCSAEEWCSQMWQVLIDKRNKRN